MKPRFILTACLCILTLTLSGCGGEPDDAETTVAIDRDAPVDPASYAGDVTFRIAETLPAQDRDVPFSLYFGLAPETATRLGANAVVDLRDLQLALPELLTETLDPSCNLSLDVDFDGAEAKGNSLRGRAAVKASIYRCRDRGTEEERRGGRLLTQTIHVYGAVNAFLEGECVAFRLADLDLAPQGLLGWLATFLGVTDRVRSTIIGEARATLSENPICTDLPETLAALDPRFTRFGLREIGGGGIGVALSGSVELSAENLVKLLSVAAERTEGSGAKARLVAAESGRLDIRIDDAIEVNGRELPYGINVRLSAAAPTRIGVETTLDLRELQHRLPDLLAGDVLVDTCGGRASLQRLDADATGARVIAKGQLDVEKYDCERTGPGSWQRGQLLSTEQVGVRADLSAEVVDGCVVFRLLDLRRDPPGAFAQLETGSGRTEAARALLMEAVGLVLEDNPLCPELPAELVVLDPSFDRGIPEEIGDGGVGIAVDGSIDVSPQSIVDLLRLLQEGGSVPPPP